MVLFVENCGVILTPKLINAIINLIKFKHGRIIMENYEEIVKREWEKFENMKLLPNIMLLGVTGCGKSSLVNRVFGKPLAEVNNVSRGTEEFKYYYGKEYGLKVNLIDSKGYEMAADGGTDNFEWYLNEVTEMIKKNKSDLEKQIHMVWFCISVASNRIQPYDIKMLNALRSNSAGIKGKVAVVLTKCDEDDEDGSTAKLFKDILHKDVAYDLPVFEVSTDKNLPLEINDLIGWSVNNLDSEDFKDAFVASQMVDIHQKRIRAAKYIAGYATGAAIVGGAPIPFSDAAILVPLQLVMTTHIIGLYGMNDLASVSKSVVGNVVISTVGKSIAGGLLKLIPGVGTVLGAIINGGVASAITGALGYAISEICYSSCKKIVRNEKIDFAQAFSTDAIQDLMKAFVNNNNKKMNKDELEKAITGNREDF